MKKGEKKDNFFQKFIKNERTFGEKAADTLTQVAGSWGFIISFLVFLVLWMIVNTTWIVFGNRWDEYPFILLNLVLSCLAAIQAPIILMSQNRQGQKDRLRMEYDYKVNRKAEKNIEEILERVKKLEMPQKAKHSVGTPSGARKKK